MPNLDQLAAEGVLFRQAFVTSPTCGPSRANIDFCYYEEGLLGFYPAKKDKTFRNLKSESQTDGLFEAFQAYITPAMRIVSLV